MKLIALAAKPPRVLSIVAVLWLLMITGAYSDAGVGILGFLALIYGGLALAAAWMARCLFFLVVRRRVSSAVPVRPAWWFVVPLCVIGAGILGARFHPPHNALFWFRFRFSEPALSRHAESLLSSSSSTESVGRRRIGLFVVRRIEARDGQVRFITTSCGVVDACGLEYSASGEPKRWQEDRFTHLHGPWWHVYEGF